jgi:hypothetical protein
MRILMVTPAYPPIGGSHMQRMLNFSNSLANEDVEVYVLTCSPSPAYPNLDYQSKELIDRRINVIYTPEGVLHRYTRVGGQLKSENIIEKRESLRIKLANKFKKKLLLPDTMIDWYFSAMKYIKRNNVIDRIKPDAIVSCSMPNTSHLIGYRLSKKYNLKLILDYGDPWAYEISVKRGKVRFKFEYFIESKILKRASHVLFATETTRQLYIREYDIKPINSSVAMMGFYEEDITNLNDVNKEVSSICLNMTYGGALNPVHRNPCPFFEAISRLDNASKIVKMHLRVDDVNTISQLVHSYKAEKSVSVEGYIPFDEYIQEANKCDILVLFGNSTPVQVSGKLFNYMGTGLRILYIKNMDKDINDPTEEILKKYGNTNFVQNTTDEIVNALRELSKEKINHKIHRVSNLSILDYSWRNQGAIFAKAVINTVNANS